MIKLICVGKLKDENLEKLTLEYIKRIKKYHRLEIFEVPRYNDLVKEKQAILKLLDKKALVIVLSPQGKEYDSKTFSHFLEKSFNHYGKIIFIIGGAEGLDNELLEQQKISFSQMTFPHQLFRLIFLEQLYRAFTIMNHEKYHK